MRQHFPSFLPKEHFRYRETEPLLKKLEQLSQRSGISRGQAFEDWLTAMVCALAAETMEDEYLGLVERHKSGPSGQRGIDLMGAMFGQLVNAMDDTEADILGDLFEGAITYGEAGQLLSPEPLAGLLAELSIDPDARPTPEKPLVVNDPCCGTGRMLLAATKLNPYLEAVGQDIDARCVKITAINLGLRGRYGHVLCGNSLAAEVRFAYQVGSFFHETVRGLRRGVIREFPRELAVNTIAARTRPQVQELFASEEQSPSRPTPTMATILEIPPWLARLEANLTATECRQQAPAKASSEGPREEREREVPPPTQQRLF